MQEISQSCKAIYLNTSKTDITFIRNGYFTLILFYSIDSTFSSPHSHPAGPIKETTEKQNASITLFPEAIILCFLTVTYPFTKFYLPYCVTLVTEDCGLLERNAIQSGRQVPTFWTKLLLPFSGQKICYIISNYIFIVLYYDCDMFQIIYWRIK